MNDMIISLLTVLASGITAAVVTHVLNSRKEERLLVRQKLEDLHLAVHRYSIAMSCGFMPFLRAMEGGLDYNQANDMLIQGADGKDKDAFPTIERLMGIYFPDLEPEMTPIVDSRKKLNDLKHAFKLDYQRGMVANGSWLEPFRMELIRSGELAEDLKRKIVHHPIKTTKRMPTIGSSTISDRADTV